MRATWCRAPARTFIHGDDGPWTRTSVTRPSIKKLFKALVGISD